MRSNSGLLCLVVGALLLVSNPGSSSFSSPFKDCRKFPFASTLPVASVSAHIVSNTRVLKDHIKVRYMGGDCGYDPSFLPVAIVPASFNAPISAGAYTSFVFSSSVAMFQLRGPPGC